ncbi:hypothetical protein [Zavarzinella formosa]|uniref:hypothetical protein n=1 Tax=Zavarzinella formosa TaxID=360055 RepID=UPI0002FEC8A0|nr:hypothetical protein [Zavarzinella formosa]
MRLLPLFGVIAILAGLPRSAAAQPAGAPVLREKYPEEYHPALKGDGKPVAGLAKFGPDADECVSFESAGLRINLPATYPRQRSGTGVITDFGVHGDFEITIGFEIIEEPKGRAPHNPTHLMLMVVPAFAPKTGVWQRSNQNRATLARELPRGKSNGRFVSVLTKWRSEPLPKDQWGNEDFKDQESVITQPPDLSPPAISRTGRLRLVRNGAELSFFASDGDGEFTILERGEFGTKDLKNVRILASTAWQGTALDVNITDLAIRAEGFPKTAAFTTADIIQTDDSPSSMQWKLITLVSGLFAASVIFLVVVYILRSRQAASEAASVNAAPVTTDSPPNEAPAPINDMAPAIVFTCPKCARRLKVKVQNAGGKLKCPGCGEIITLPSPTAKTEGNP